MSAAALPSTGNVVALNPFSEDEALRDLCARGKTRLTLIELGSAWQWHPKKVGRTLDKWAKSQPPLIRRRKSLITPLAAPGATPHPSSVASVSRPGAAPVRRTRPRPVLVSPTEPLPPAAPVAPVPSPVPGHVPNRHKWLGAFAILLGVAASLVGLGWSIGSLASGGQNTAGRWLVVAICIVIELLAIVLPSVGTALWALRSRAMAAVMWCGYAAALGMVVFNGIGFAGTQIGDAVAGRAHALGTAGDLRGELAARLEEKRGLIYVPVDAAQIDAAEGKRDQACERGTKRDCDARGSELAALGRQRAANERLTAIDGEIKILREKIATAPALGAADPQVESTIEVLAWASGGTVVASKRAVEVPRLLGLVLIPSVMGGLLLAAGMLLWQGRSR